MAEKIGVIGGSGFIGTRLARRLLSSGHNVRIVDKSISKNYPKLWTCADVRNIDSLRKTLTGCNVLFNLAAAHEDNVRPVSLYDEVNVQGAKNVCSVAAELGIRKIIFTSTVAVYGFPEGEQDESGDLKPFNDYGRSKMEAEAVYCKWLSESNENTLVIVRPTVVFGEKNRGNVYNLIRQISSKRFIMVGKGTNKKSMAYVENVAAFLEYSLKFGSGLNLFNYADKPDYDMNTLSALIKEMVGMNGKKILRIPYRLGLLGGAVLDFFSVLTGKNFPISKIRISKFCADTCFSSSAVLESGFVPPCTLDEGMERTIRSEFLSKGRG